MRKRSDFVEETESNILLFQFTVYDILPEAKRQDLLNSCCCSIHVNSASGEKKKKKKSKYSSNTENSPVHQYVYVEKRTDRLCCSMILMMLNLIVCVV